MPRGKYLHRNGSCCIFGIYAWTTNRNAGFNCSISPLLIPNFLATTRQLEISRRISFKIRSARSLFNWYKCEVSRAKEISNSLLFSELFKGKKLPNAKQVAEFGYRSMIKGKTVAVHGMMNYILANSIRFIPRAIVLKVSRKILDKAWFLKGNFFGTRAYPWIGGIKIVYNLFVFFAKPMLMFANNLDNTTTITRHFIHCRPSHFEIDYL